MAILLNADNEYLEIADNAKWDFTPVTNTRTLNYYYQTSSLPNVDGEYQMFFGLYSAGNSMQVILVRNSGLLFLTFGIYDAVFTQIGVFYVQWTPTVNTWYHISGVFSTSGNCKIYINGVAQSVTHSSWDDTTAISAAAIRISNASNIDDDFQIAHFSWFSDELSSTEVGNIMRKPYSFDSDANILCSIHFDEMTGTNANDIQTVATQTDGTLVNAITWVQSPWISGGKAKNVI